MAWRIDRQILRGEIDNRTRGRITGKLWLAGRNEPVTLDLEGNPWSDLAGHLLTFANPKADIEATPDTAGFAPMQRGKAGEMTASRKVRVPDCTLEEFLECFGNKQPFPWHWGNSLYLEWFSENNGRVVIESTDYQLTLDPEPAWRMTAAEQAAQAETNTSDMPTFLERLAHSTTHSALDTGNPDDEDDDEPQSDEEAEADAHDARMNLIFDRIDARIARGEISHEDFDRAYEEERAKLKRELGEPDDPEPTPEQIEEQNRWIEEMNAAADEAIAELEAEKWKSEGLVERERHPLVIACSDLAVGIRRQIKAAGWLPEDAAREHPLIEIIDGVTIASAKLAGAVGMSFDDEEWPPDPLIAGNVIVRLKKARNWLRDAIRGLDSADEENLATPAWRQQTRLGVAAILARTQQLIEEARAVLKPPPES